MSGLALKPWCYSLKASLYFVFSNLSIKCILSFPTKTVSWKNSTFTTSCCYPSRWTWLWVSNFDQWQKCWQNVDIRIVRFLASETKKLKPICRSGVAMLAGIPPLATDSNKNPFGKFFRCWHLYFLWVHLPGYEYVKF